MSDQKNGTITKPYDEDEDSTSPSTAVIVLRWVAGLAFALFIIIWPILLAIKIRNGNNAAKTTDYHYRQGTFNHDTTTGWNGKYSVLPPSGFESYPNSYYEKNIKPYEFGKGPRN